MFDPMHRAHRLFTPNSPLPLPPLPPPLLLPTVHSETLRELDRSLNRPVHDELALDCSAAGCTRGEAWVMVHDSNLSNDYSSNDYLTFGVRSMILTSS